MTYANKIIPHSKPWITKDDESYVQKVLHGGLIAQGELVEKFERSICEYLKVHSAVATSSGSSALLSALYFLKIPVHSEVILPTYVCGSVLDAVIAYGATPVICDVGPNWVMTAEQVKAVLTKKTSAIIGVHIFGVAADIYDLKKFGVPVIEDACQAFGLIVDGKAAGGLGDVGILSFNATKCMTTAEGGMLVINSDNFVVRDNFALDNKSLFPMKAFFPMSDIQAAMGLSQLGRYHEFVSRRNDLKKKYIKGLQCIDKVILPSDDDSFLFRFPLRGDFCFEKLESLMYAHKVQVRRGVDSLNHRIMNLDDSKYQNAIMAFNETVSIPFYPALTDASCERVIEALRESCL